MSRDIGTIAAAGALPDEHGRAGDAGDPRRRPGSAPGTAPGSESSGGAGSAPGGRPGPGPDAGSARVDVWLWSVRQARTRSAATAACRAGHVRVNGEPAKPAQRVSVGDEVRYRVDGFDRLLTVQGILTKRVGAPVARTAYLDHSPARPAPIDAPAPIVRDRGAGRPTKKERRALESLRAGRGRGKDIESLLDPSAED